MKTSSRKTVFSNDLNRDLGFPKNYVKAYRYGMNGQEKEKEITNSQSHYSAEHWMYDARLGRRWNVDPMKKRDPDLTPYRFGFNNPIRYYDKDGAYETDGHFWTVLIIATRLRLSNAREIAYWSENPDWVMNMNTMERDYETRTWLNQYHQLNLHAFTMVPLSADRTTRRWGINGILSSTNSRDIGLWCHYYGDSYSHTNEVGWTYVQGTGHALDHSDEYGLDASTHWVDHIGYRPDLYLKYVTGLGKALSRHSGFDVDVNQVNMQDLFIFRFVARSNLSTEQNMVVMETEYLLMTGNQKITISAEYYKVVDRYLTETLVEMNQTGSKNFTKSLQYNYEKNSSGQEELKSVTFDIENGEDK